MWFPHQKVILSTAYNLYTPTLLTMAPIILASNEKLHSPFQTCVGRTKNTKTINYILFHVFVAICNNIRWVAVNIFLANFLLFIKLLFLKNQTYDILEFKSRSMWFYFFQISNIENLAKISNKKNSQISQIYNRKTKISHFICWKIKKICWKNKQWCQYLLLCGSQPIKVFPLNFVR